MKTRLLLLFLVSYFGLYAQQPSQTVRGTVQDSETNFPLPGARVEIFTGDSTQKFRALTDENGRFSIRQVPVGKQELRVQMLTYDPKTLTIEVISGKETVVTVPMDESFSDQEEVTVTATKKGEVLNEMALISAQQFSVEETNRYAGSRSDPARMASNFAGVQGADDSRNDIVVRGNSPLGVVYKVEGVDIPNPNHFAVSGSSGGPVSIINNKSLANSDFFMSAFPAEYGNSISGIFDLNLRNGNQNTHEFTGQFGFLGTEILAEGPLSQNSRASYLVMGRYSTLSIFQQLGIQIGTDAVPVYGDGAFKFNFPLKKGGVLSWYGIGGKSNISILISEQKKYSNEFYGEGDRDQYFGTSMYTSGLNYKKPLSENTLISATFAVAYDEQHSHHDYLTRHLETDASGDTNIVVDSIYPLMGYYFRTTRASAFFSVNHKFSRRSILKAGINVDGFYFNNLDSALNTAQTDFITRWNYQGTAMLVQPFVQWKYRITEDMDFTAGLHAQYFSLSNSVSPAEPRLGWKYRFGKNQSVFAGAGLHSQTQPYYTYTYQRYTSDGRTVLHNKNMDFTKSIHTGIGYEKSFKKGFNVRSEAYYQYLYNVPVTNYPSSFSLINQGSGFARFFPDTLVNEGTGVNYGIELTVQKYFDKSFYFLFSGTLYDSKYTGSDGIQRNTSYNGRYVANLLGGKEWKIGERQTIGAGLKITVAGGKRYGYVNLAQSQLLNEIIYLDSMYNERQFKDYFRTDLKVTWRLNAAKVTHEIGLDLVNIFNTQNLLSLAYAPNLANPSAEPIAVKKQLGFLPIFYYKIDFKVGKKKTN